MEDVLGGYTGTILCYGQTGSGKTYTMIAPEEDSVMMSPRDLSPNSGLAPRIIQQVCSSPVSVSLGCGHGVTWSHRVWSRHQKADGMSRAHIPSWQNAFFFPRRVSSSH